MAQFRLTSLILSLSWSFCQLPSYPSIHSFLFNQSEWMLFSTKNLPEAPTMWLLQEEDKLGGQSVTLGYPDIYFL